jgi:tetratricopeptide (TPR) repeat protein
MQSKSEQDPVREHLRWVADAADDDPWRRAFRAAALGGDEEAIRALACHRQALAQPPTVLARVGSILHSRDLAGEAAAFLRQAQDRHPGDFLVTYTLGRTLLDCPPGKEPPEEAVGYCRAAVAIRPSSRRANQLLVFALYDKGKRDTAVFAYRLALELGFKHAPCNLADALHLQGDLDGAIALYREALRHRHAYRDYTHHQLGKALAEKGLPPAAPTPASSGTLTRIDAEKH